jgi:hypothetical protein
MASVTDARVFLIMMRHEESAAHFSHGEAKAKVNPVSGNFFTMI